jgi:hypothetical protein
MTAPVSSRMLALDYLRGFFIVVIIIDHLWRWPSLLSFITGEGQLWVSAAEGFIIISGLLVGYIRGFKNRDQPFFDVTKKLLLRALILYIWLVIMTIAYTALTWTVEVKGHIAWLDIAKNDWNVLISQTLTMQYTHPWIHFLYMYTIFLAITPIAIWFFRRRLAWVVIVLSLVGHSIGKFVDQEWMWWLPLFFVPAVCGYYLPTVQSWWSRIGKTHRQHYLVGLYMVTGITVAGSVVCTFLLVDNPVALWLNTFFSKEYSLHIWRVVLALVWFIAFVMVFQRITPWLDKYTRGVLLPFGTRSLTAYIVHGAVVFAIAIYVADSESVLVNTGLGVLAIGMTWVIITSPWVQKIIPR